MASVWYNESSENMTGLKKFSAVLLQLLLAVFLAITPAKSAFALSKPAIDFLLSISVDPASENVKLADQDGTVKTIVAGDPEENSLESLAIAKKTNGVKNFINTRVLVRRLKADFSNTEIPKAGDSLYPYDPRYMTVDERKLVGKKFS